MSITLRCLFAFFALTALFAAPAFAQRDIGQIDEGVSAVTIPVRVSGTTPELNALAIQAFSSHGRYHLTASASYVYDLHFSAIGPGQVRVDISQRNAVAPIASETASGTTLREAFFAAADLAVVKTNGQGLRGYFTSRLVFISDRTGHPEIYTSDLFFGDVRQITHDRAIAMMPRWAPDGERILYTSFFKSGFPDIFEINLSNYQRSTFVSFKGTNSGAHFSPDGRQVAMVLSGEGNPDIYVSNAQGLQVSRRTHSDSAKASPAWSPDGSRIIFAMEPGPQLYVIPSGGGAARRVSFNCGGYCAEPDWSRADPTKVVFTMKNGASYQIGVLDLSTSQGKQVSNAPFDGIEPSWLPDGRHVVYTARTRTESRVSLLDTLSGKSVPLSPASFGSTRQANVWAR